MRKRFCSNTRWVGNHLQTIFHLADQNTVCICVIRRADSIAEEDRRSELDGWFSLERERAKQQNSLAAKFTLLLQRLDLQIGVGMLDQSV